MSEVAVGQGKPDMKRWLMAKVRFVLVNHFRHGSMRNNHIIFLGVTWGGYSYSIREGFDIELTVLNFGVGIIVSTGVVLPYGQRRVA